MEVFIKGENLQEILETKNSLECGGYKGDIKVVMTNSLEKDILEKIGPATAIIREDKISQIFGMDIVPVSFISSL